MAYSGTLYTDIRISLLRCSLVLWRRIAMLLKGTHRIRSCPSNPGLSVVVRLHFTRFGSVRFPILVFFGRDCLTVGHRPLELNIQFGLLCFLLVLEFNFELLGNGHRALFAAQIH